MEKLTIKEVLILVAFSISHYTTEDIIVILTNKEV